MEPGVVTMSGLAQEMLKDSKVRAACLGEGRRGVKNRAIELPEFHVDRDR
jgi:hypothetical protein